MKESCYLLERLSDLVQDQQNHCHFAVVVLALVDQSFAADLDLEAVVVVVVDGRKCLEGNP